MPRKGGESAADQIKGMMKGQGPTCKCVVLKHDGSAEEKTLDMSPGWETKVLGAQPTIIGMYEALEVVVIATDMEEVKDKAKAKELKEKKNTHELPEPFENDDDIYGDIILFRTDDDSEPCDFPLADWEEYVKDPKAKKFMDALEEREKRLAEYDNEEIGDEDDEDDDEEGDDDEGPGGEGDDDDDDDDEEEDEEEEEAPKGKRPAKKGNEASPSKKRK